MSDLSKRLRDLASAKHDDLSVASEAADLIDQQAAELADLKLRLNRWNSGDNSIGAKEQVKRLMVERDEWRRSAERLMVLASKWANPRHHDWEEIEEAAKWFEEN